MSDFKNKIIWLTGASSGIGKAVMNEFLTKGAFVIISSRKEDVLNEIKNQSPYAQQLFVQKLDLADQTNYKEITKNLISKFNKIDYLINNGGISQRSEAATTSLEVDKKIMEVNYFGNIALTKAVLPFMQKQKSGHIITISSIAGKFGFFLRSAYSASKHALHGFYESLRLEEEKNNINVTIICPGKIRTNISVNALSGDGSSHASMDDNQANGMSAEECARQILKAISKNKKEVLIGNKEIKAVTLKRLFPKLFYKIIKKQKAT